MWVVSSLRRLKECAVKTESESEESNRNLKEEMLRLKLKKEGKVRKLRCVLRQMQY